MMTALSEEDNYNVKREGGYGIKWRRSIKLSIGKSSTDESILNDTKSRYSSILLVKDRKLKQRKKFQFSQKLSSTIKYLPPVNAPSISSLILDEQRLT